MEAIVITVQGGIVAAIEKIIDSPKEGFLIIDLDKIHTSTNKEKVKEEMETAVNNFYDLDGEVSYDTLVEELKQAI